MGQRSGRAQAASPAGKRATDKITQRLIVDLEIILRLLRPSIADDWFTVELTMPQLRALFALRRHGDSRMGTVASQLGTSLSTSTGVIDRLVERGLVERWQDPDDRRSNVCRLTDEGIELAERLLNLRRREWEERLSGLTDDEASEAQRGLTMLLEGLARVEQSETTAAEAAEDRS